jgi:hypothetical protein
MNQFASTLQGTGQAAGTAAPEHGIAVITHPDRSKRSHLPGGQTINVNADGVSMTGDNHSVPGVPGLPGPRDMDFRNAIPTGVVAIVQASGATLVRCVVGFPPARAFGRWLDRRGSAPTIPPEVMTRLSSIENAVETVAVEVKRISEGQRFTTRLLNERAARDLQAPVGAGDRVGR